MDFEDEDTFEVFFRASWPRLFRVALAIVGDAQHAEDAVQMAMVRVCTRWSRVERMASPGGYARRIVVNECLGQRRTSSRRGETPADLTGLELVPLVADQPPGLWDAITSLPQRQRAVIVLRYYEGLSEAEIAEVLGCRPGTVKSQASAALAHLRQTVQVTEGDQS